MLRENYKNKDQMTPFFNTINLAFTAWLCNGIRAQNFENWLT